jgi:hypothetical protein
MAGQWIIAVASRLIREETFEMMVAPAIADLQHEGEAARLRNYVAVAGVLVHAALNDFRVDVGAAFSRDVMRAAWKPASLWYLGFIVLLPFGAILDARGVTRLGTDGTAFVLGSSFVLIAVVAISWAMAPAVFFMARAHRSRRVILASTVVIAVATTMLATGIRPVRNTIDGYRRAAIWRSLNEPLDLNRPLEELVPMLRGPLFRSELARIHRLDDLRLGAAVCAFSLVGLALSRSQGWWLAVRAAAMFGAWLAIASPWLFPWLFRARFPLGYAEWLNLAVIILIAAASLAIPFRRRLSATAVTP